MEFLNCIGYCIHCYHKVGMIDCSLEYCKNGKPQIKGTCKECNHQVLRFLTRLEKEKLDEQGKI